MEIFDFYLYKTERYTAPLFIVTRGRPRKEQQNVLVFTFFVQDHYFGVNSCLVYELMDIFMFVSFTAKKRCELSVWFERKREERTATDQERL